jgi:hypothetical protein
MTRPDAAPEPDPPRPPGTPDLDVGLPAGEGGDDEPGNLPGEDVEPDAGAMEPPD